jgi:signal transduction histidine kinase
MARVDRHISDISNERLIYSIYHAMAIRWASPEIELYAGNDKKRASDPSQIINERGNVFFRGLSLSLCAILCSYAAYGIFINMYVAAMFDILLAVPIGFSYLLCKANFFLSAKKVFLTTMNFGIYVFALSYPMEVGLYMIYLPTIVVTIIIFHSNHRRIRYMFIVTSLLAMGSLIFLRPEILPIAPIEPDMIRQSFLMNLFASLLVLFIALYNLMNLIDQTDHSIVTKNASLLNKNEELTEAYSKLNKFTYSVSHDLRSPLANIKGLSSLGLFESPNSTISIYFQKISESADKLDGFIKESLNYYKTNKEGRLEDIDLHDAIAEIIESFRHMKNASDIDFQLTCEPEDSTFMLDQFLFKTVISNLISNAIKYHHSDERHKFLRIDVLKYSNELVIQVEDNGNGIDNAHLTRIFDLFYKANNGCEKGTGIGLSLVKEAMQKMKGSIDLVSTLEEGTTFTLRIPQLRTASAGKNKYPIHIHEN